MIEIITPGAHNLYDSVLESMFRFRFRTLIAGCGWRAPAADHGFDRDNYDHQKTVYFVAYAPRSTDIIACARLNPTQSPHMMSDLFAPYCNLQPAPTGPSIFEASRFAVDCARLVPIERNAVRGRLEHAITDYAVRRGIARIMHFGSQKAYTHALQLWTTQPLGLPAYFKDDARYYIPAISTMDEAALKRITDRIAAQRR